MSANSFYQTFYQSDQLFRLADERWETTQPAEAEIAEASLNAPNLLAELDELLASRELKAVSEPVVEEIPIAEPDLAVYEVEPTAVEVLAAPEPEVVNPEPVYQPEPEPLPQAVPRPTVPPAVPAQPARKTPIDQKVLLLADEALDPSNLLFLEKILKAVNLNIDGVDLLNLQGVQDVDFAELVHGKHIHHFITFGVPFERIHLDILMDRYSPVRMFGITFLMADSLPTIEADQNLKRRLWGSLQRMFPQR